jgi:hypothetical protein
LPAPDAPSTGGPLRYGLGWASIGVGAAGIASGFAFGAAALGARDDFLASNRLDADAHDRAATLRTLANVGYFAGGALAAAGVILVLTAPSEPQVAIVFGPRGVVANARF